MMDKEKRGEEAYKLHEQIKKNETYRRQLLAENAKLLSDIQENKFYKEILGDETSDWKSYLSQLEVFYSRSKIFNQIRVYKRFTKELGIAQELYIDIPLSRLVDLLPISKDVSFNNEEWFDKARTLLTKDWKIEIRQAKGLVTEEDEHEHDCETYSVCKICGAKDKKSGI